MTSIFLLLYALAIVKSQEICAEWLHPNLSTSLTPSTPKTEETSSTQTSTPSTPKVEETLSTQTSPPSTPKVEETSSTQTSTPSTPKTEETLSTQTSTPSTPKVEETSSIQTSTPSTPKVEETSSTQTSTPSTPKVEETSSTQTSTPSTPKTEETLSTQTSTPSTPKVEETSSTQTSTPSTPKTEETSSTQTTEQTTKPTNPPFIAVCKWTGEVPNSELEQLCNNIERENFVFLDSFRRGLKAPQEQNVAVCIGSVITLLGMSLLGAKGETSDEIVNLSIFDNIHHADHLMEMLFEVILKNSKKTHAMESVNAIIVDPALDSIILGSNYLRNIILCFRAIYKSHNFSKETDFKNDPKFNNSPYYTPFKYGAHLPSKNTGLMFTSSMFFNGSPDIRKNNIKLIWTQFLLSNGASQQTEFIQMSSEKFYYYENDQITLAGGACRTPPVSGVGRYLFIFMLPKSQNLLQKPNISEVFFKAYKELVTWENFRKRNRQHVQITIPKFQIGYNEKDLHDVYDLKPILKTMGVRKIFSPKEADLSIITENGGQKPVYVANVFHMSGIIFNKKNMLGYGGGVAHLEYKTPLMPEFKKREPSKQFNANRPFLVFIVSEFKLDKFKHLVPIFSGVVMNPNLM